MSSTPRHPRSYPVLALIFGTRCAMCRCAAQSTLCDTCADRVRDAHTLAPAGTLLLASPPLLAMIRRAKRAASRNVAQAMISLAEPPDLDPRPEIVTWVPADPQRGNERGTHFPEAVGRALARHYGAVATGLLRARPGAAQRGSSRAQRVRNVDGRFSSALPVPPGEQVLLVDDVITTGATLASAANALRDAGAQVTTLALAGVPKLHVFRPQKILGVADTDVRSTTRTRPINGTPHAHAARPPPTPSG